MNGLYPEGQCKHKPSFLNAQRIVFGKAEIFIPIQIDIAVIIGKKFLCFPQMQGVHRQYMLRVGRAAYKEKDIDKYLQISGHLSLLCGLFNRNLIDFRPVLTGDKHIIPFEGNTVQYIVIPCGMLFR